MSLGGTGPKGRKAGKAAKSKSDKTPKSAKVKCVEAKLVKLEWLDDTPDAWDAFNKGTLKNRSRPGRQIVNFPREKEWTQLLVASYDRLGHSPPLRVTFNKPGSHRFTITVKKVVGGEDYTTTEEERLPDHFKHTKVFHGVTDVDGIAVIQNVKFAAAGMDKYSIEAVDAKGNKQSAPEIEVWRKVYYYELKMQNVPAVTDLKTVRDEYEKHAIQLRSLGSTQISRQENIGSSAEENILLTNARAAFGASARRYVPHLHAIVYTDHLAVRNRNVKLTKPVNIPTTGGGIEEVPVTATNLLPPHNTIYSPKFPKPLWRNIVSGQGWRRSARYVTTGGTSYPITVEAQGGNPCYKVNANLAGLPPGSGTIEIFVDVVDRFRGGRANSGSNLILVATRSWWRNVSDAIQNETVIHEMGHMFRFVPDGSTLDRTPMQYSAHGHRGSHCATGLNATQLAQASYADAAAGLSAGCVMFGSLSRYGTRTAFCEKCKKALRKQDFCRGWEMF